MTYKELVIRILLFYLAIICSSTVLLSDQAAWITKREAIAASRFLKIGDIVYSYCAPCGDPNALMIEVSSISVKSVGEKRYHELRINNIGVDLAYIYVIQDSKYENLALLSNIEVQNVPKYLSDEKRFLILDNWQQHPEIIEIKKVYNRIQKILEYGNYTKEESS